MAKWVAVTIANGAAVSNAITLSRGERLIGIQTPSAWTAADIYVQVTVDDVTWFDIADSAGVELILATSVATGAAEFRLTSPLLAAGATQGIRDLGLGRVRLRSGNTAGGADVNQGAARTVNLLIGE